MEEKDVKIVEERYIQVSESRIKNTIKEYKKGQPFGWVLSSSFSCMISFFIAFVSYQSDESSVWKWIFLSLAILSTAILLLFGIITLARKKLGTGTEKWFLEEIRDDGHVDSYHSPRLFGSFDPDLIFKVIKNVLLIGIPVSILLLVLGLNGWDISNKEWCAPFWVFWTAGSLVWLVFGTPVIAFFAYAMFGYEYDFL